MKKPPHTEKRGGQWWYRRRVPAELVPIVGRAEFRESLKTPDVEVARTRAALRDAEVAIEFEQAREALRRRARVPTLPDELTPEQKQFIAEAVRSHVLGEDEAVRMARPDPDSMDAYESIRADQFDETVQALRSGRVAWGRQGKEQMASLLQAIGVSVAPGSPAWNAVAYKATEGLHRALKDINQRMRGDFVPTPPPPAMPAALKPTLEEVPPGTPRVVRLGEVIDHHLKGLPENGFKRKVRRCLQLFGEMVGRDLPIADLRQRAVTEFLRDICRLPNKWARRFDAGESIESLLEEGAEKVMSPTTFEGSYRGPLGTFLTSAAQNFGDEGMRLLSTDKIRYVGNRVPDEEQQRALRDDELRVLFEGEEFARVAANPKDEPLYWLLTVMLYTGARPREVCQINPQADWGQFEGWWYLDLTEKTPAGLGVTKSIKTGEARRLPLHVELVRLGFVDYLKRMRAAGADRLFPLWRVKQGNPYTAHYERVATLLKRVKLYDRDAPPGELVTGAYVLRKTFITQCRNQGVVSKEITGHSDGMTTRVQDRSYVFGPEPFQRKREELGKLVMPVAIPLPTHAGRT